MIWRIYLQKARNENARGNIDAAIAYLYKMLKFRPSVNAKILLGYFLMKNNRFDQAKPIFENYILNDRRVLKPDKQKKGKIKRNRAALSAQTNYALLLWKTGNIEQAIALLESVHRKMHTTDLYCNLGYLYIVKGDLKKALAYNLKAYDFSPESNGICDNLGCTYYQLGEYEQALSVYEEIMAHEKKPGFPECYYNYGQVLEQFGQYEKAAAQYTHALQLEFNGFCNISREQVEAALKNLSQTEPVSP